MKKKISKKLAFLILGSIFLLSSISVCFALIVKQTESVTNTFELGEIKCSIAETFDGTTKEDVSVKNDSLAEVFIRSKIVVTWVSKDGKSVYSDIPVLGEDYDLVLNENTWFKGSDGFYYYEKPVLSGDSTQELIIEAVQLENADKPENFQLSIEILAEAIQANPRHAVSDVWTVVAYNGTKLVPAN